MGQHTSKPADDETVQFRRRVDASLQFAKLTDRLSRRLSRYDDPGAKGNLDEGMVMNGIAFLLGHWWRDLSDAEVEVRIRNMAVKMLESRRELLEQKGRKVN